MTDEPAEPSRPPRSLDERRDPTDTRESWVVAKLFAAAVVGFLGFVAGAIIGWTAGAYGERSRTLSEAQFTAQVGTLRCAECGVTSDDGVGWRALLAFHA